MKASSIEKKSRENRSHEKDRQNCREEEKNRKRATGGKRMSDAITKKGLKSG